MRYFCIQIETNMKEANGLRGDSLVYETLRKLDIPFEYYEHPEAPTVEIAMKYWEDLDAQHCKNLFFRNHKGNKHFLVILDCHYQLNIKDLEQRLKQGKLTFASPERMLRYLAIQPGSVSPFGLIHDNQHHVHLFLDIHLQKAHKISFHPNDNTASLVVSFDGFMKFLQNSGNSYEFLELY
jgi:Ala-tRNA(Pro) deacylase